MASRATSSRMESGSKRNKDECQPLIPLETLDNFILGKLLGSGSYGAVYEVTDRNTGKSYALKKISKGEADELTQIEEIQSEILLLCQLHSHCQPYLLCYEGYFEDTHNIYILTESLKNYQPLTDLIDPEKLGHQAEPSMELIINLVEGLTLLHAQGIAHRDIKPDNILTQGDHIKYIDFGLSCGHANECEDGFKGTPNYFAPEMHGLMSGGSAELSLYDYQLFDVWALGATLYDLCVGAPPLEIGIDDYLEVSGVSQRSLNRMDEIERALAKYEIFCHYFQFPSKFPQIAQYDQIVINFDAKLRAYTKAKIGRAVSIVKMLQPNPSKRSLYADSK